MTLVRVSTLLPSITSSEGREREIHAIARIVYLPPVLHERREVVCGSGHVADGAH